MNALKSVARTQRVKMTAQPETLLTHVTHVWFLINMNSFMLPHGPI